MLSRSAVGEDFQKLGVSLPVVNTSVPDMLFEYNAQKHEYQQRIDSETLNKFTLWQKYTPLSKAKALLVDYMISSGLLSFTTALFAIFFHLTNPKSESPQFNKLISALLPVFVIEFKGLIMGISKLKKVLNYYSLNLLGL